ncbi:MAG: FeoA domain-containing protein [Bryobacterales bacterium]|nr:FeoA domain-containing protein [Acidobacteriota bacterium]MCB9385782.1 FeoA domain-containing protein [Bryobacterales bacterium]
MTWVYLAVALAVLFTPRFGLLAQLARHRAEGRRALYEDVLKHMLAWERRGKTATPESVAGALELAPKRVLDLITRMETRGLLVAGTDGISLTAEGERLALHVVRAHRLWERYLADDAGMPMGKLHQAAEKAEHNLSPEQVDELEAHLGHPERDPHGDPIPTSAGELPPLEGVALTAWAPSEAARIVHVEDEPAVIFQQILAAELRPGMTIRVLESSPERIILSDGTNEIRLARAVAANIQVAAPQRAAARPAGAIRLSQLRSGVKAEVLKLDEECRGFSRRRLMDLGLTPHASIEVALENTFGDPRGFRIRGTTIALRKAQARNVWVTPVGAAA